jgi:excisionase family DNA binding protein
MKNRRRRRPPRTLNGLNAAVRQCVQHDRPLTPRQLASFFQVSLRTIERQTRTGEIPHVRIGNRTRFIPSDVLRRLREKTQS